MTCTPSRRTNFLVSDSEQHVIKNNVNKKTAFANIEIACLTVNRKCRTIYEWTVKVGFTDFYWRKKENNLYMVSR